MPQSRPPMENYNYYWERPPPPPAVPPRHRKNNPSFSSSLLDAITRSIDDSDSSVAAGGEPHRHRNPSGGAPDPAARRNYSSSSSSSSSSSFFSSSDADTPIRIRPIRTGPVPARADRIRSDPPLEKPNQTQKEQKQLTSIKKKLRELRRSAGPASPGARLAGFLNSLFHPAGAGKTTKKKPSASASSGSSSSCSRSCLSKTPSTRGSGAGKRSVRFSPVGVIVGEDCRPCGEKAVFAGDFPAPARKAAVVEELMRAVAMEEDYESDSSEDLFELENLGGILRGAAGDEGTKNRSGNASFRDELPVYETTSLGINRAIARGLIV